MTVEIRPVGPDDYEAWLPLWNGYLDFYRATLKPGTSEITWARFHDAAEPMFVLGAYVDGKLTGIVHFIYHRSCWTAGDYCYLQDLFVADSARGLGLGRKLIEAVYARATADGCSRVHWLTKTDNIAARQLYDRIAEDSGFMQYRHLF
ncbi:GNAT family N-acetyltransferase [Rhodopseudomonas sp. B29]|uniref:GNAT family N-acetyltransferase n=1 Tax=Rhodopseudomonas sp. B29 TaxID=95607 RepID=UPI0003485160|nr:GNAT family N-acetyltransferase [Rhodopseudomonas sp. B29]